MFITRLFDNPQFYMIWLLLVVFSICCHEYAHARVALWQGDPTAANAGHLTLNPLKQMGIISLLMLIFIGIAWGMVPVSPRMMKHRYSHVMVSLAGPLTNLGLFLFFSVFLGLLPLFTEGVSASGSASAAETAGHMFFLGGMLNLVLFMFNMLPVPGLDGWMVLNTFFHQLYAKKAELVNLLSFVMIILSIAFIDYLFRAAGHATIFISSNVHRLVSTVG